MRYLTDFIQFTCDAVGFLIDASIMLGVVITALLAVAGLILSFF